MGEAFFVSPSLLKSFDFVRSSFIQKMKEGLDVVSSSNATGAQRRKYTLVLCRSAAEAGWGRVGPRKYTRNGSFV